MLLIAGLGNPDSKYRYNRHNIGFLTLDRIADDWRLGPWKAKFQGAACDGTIDTPEGPKKVLLLKPGTYYNESGRAVGEAARYYNIPASQIVVFHDELDLAPGKFRLKTGGGHAGNNGLRSIMAHVEGDFRRGRIGIGHPGDKNRVTGYVLSDIPKADQRWAGDLMDAIARSVPLLAAGEFDAFQTKVTHLAPAPGQTDKD
ncbi:aminoacyl-tRNA hydrolase [Hyphobacterium sp. HN65]|uniref:Peptidyl-tRNA hydrolase n=1 Tax=Hyphobacterium lacteum TaxID=3116575 RepID=A0ABU7LS22_9PROT|nr:aminoacyl-tRNA hydrolase [Hyphobacterium sp. HN65]MEE2526441.1 aminoacyl-tRNA hydrolase [Hyphobacterium sp. HN65]